MGTRFDYPNMDAIDQMGVLDAYDKAHGYPPGWSRSVIEKIQHDHAFTGHGRDTVSHDNKSYPPDEQALWDYYNKDVIEESHWKKIVADYNAKITKPDNVTPPVFDPKTQYIPKVDTNFKPPTLTPFNGGDKSGGHVAVSTDALEYFAREIDQVAGDGKGLLFDAHKALEVTALRPGGFAKAEVLRQTVDGSGSKDLGLRGETMNLLKTVHEALFAVKQNLRAVAKEYDSAEELNGLTADKLNDAMDPAWGKIGNIKDYGTKGTSSTGSSSTGGSSTGGSSTDK